MQFSIYYYIGLNLPSKESFGKFQVEVDLFWWRWQYMGQPVQKSKPSLERGRNVYDWPLSVLSPIQSEESGFYWWTWQKTAGWPTEVGQSGQELLERRWEGAVNCWSNFTERRLRGKKRRDGAPVLKLRCISASVDIRKISCWKHFNWLFQEPTTFRNAFS